MSARLDPDIEASIRKRVEDQTASHEGWPTIGEVKARTGMSERSVYRAVSDGKLRTAQQPIPGRKPLPVYHPEDVDALERAATAGKTTVMRPAAMTEYTRQNTPPPEFWTALVEALRPQSAALQPASEETSEVPEEPDTTAESELPPLAELRQKLIVTRAEAKRLGFTPVIMAVAISDGKLHMLRGRRYLMRELESL